MKVRLRKLRRLTCVLASRPATLARLLLIQRKTGQHSHGNVRGFLAAYLSYLFAEDLRWQISKPGFARRMFSPSSVEKLPYTPAPFVYTQEDADRDRREAAARKAKEKATGKLSVKSLIDASFL